MTRKRYKNIETALFELEAILWDEKCEDYFYETGWSRVCVSEEELLGLFIERLLEEGKEIISIEANEGEFSVVIADGHGTKREATGKTPLEAIDKIMEERER